MDTNRSPLARIFGDAHHRRPLMTAYERFEQIVALALSLIIAVVIVIALFQLLKRLAARARRRARPPGLTRCSRPCSA